MGDLEQRVAIGSDEAQLGRVRVRASVTQAEQLVASVVWSLTTP